MDIAIVGKTSIKIKGKQVTFIVDPSREIPKISSDAIILSNGYDNIDISRVTDCRIVINGAGEYEVNGAKISGATSPKGILYKLSIDDVSIIVGRAMESKTDGFSACQIVVINADGEFNESFVTALEPKIVVIYGTSKIDAAKTLGAENLTAVSKITTTKDKLPEKMEIVVLG